jgi:hypothetical protein
MVRAPQAHAHAGAGTPPRDEHEPAEAPGTNPLTTPLLGFGLLGTVHIDIKRASKGGRSGYPNNERKHGEGQGAPGQT